MIRSTIVEYPLPIWLNPDAYLGEFVMVMDGQLVEDSGGVIFLSPHDLPNLTQEDQLLMRPLLIGSQGADYA